MFMNFVKKSKVKLSKSAKADNNGAISRVASSGGVKEGEISGKVCKNATNSAIDIAEVVSKIANSKAVSQLEEIVLDFPTPKDRQKKIKRVKSKRLISSVGNSSLLEDFNFKKIHKNRLPNDSSLVTKKKLEVSSKDSGSEDVNKGIDFDKIFVGECSEVSQQTIEHPTINNIQMTERLDTRFNNLDKTILDDAKPTDSIFGHESDMKECNLEYGISCRKMAIINHSTKSVNIPYNLLNSTLYLPSHFKRISELYKAISIIYEFNQKRGLNLVFCKYRKSIERMFKRSVQFEDLEKLKYLAQENIEFKLIHIVDEGKTVETFTISILKKINIDRILYELLIGSYNKWIAQFDIVDYRDRFHPGFKMDDVVIPSEKIIEIKESSVVQLDQKSDFLIKVDYCTESKAHDVFERVREKERQRRAAFVVEKNDQIDLKNKIQNIFEISNKKAIRMDELIFRIGGFDCKKRIEQFIQDSEPKYCIKSINGEEYVVGQ